MKKMAGNIIHLRHLAIALLFIPLLTGCGPGFPIITIEQEKMELDVASLKEESTVYKERIAKLEKGFSGDDGVGLEGLDFEIRKTRAELDADINGLREEMASLKGELEASRHTAELLREAIGDIEIKVEEEVASREKSTQPGQQLITGMEAQLSSVTARLDDLERRLLPIEKGALSAKVKASTIPREKPETLYNKSLLLLKDKAFEKSLTSFTRFIELFPDHGLADNAQYWIGEIFYAQGDWERAVLEFDTVIKKYPDGDKVPAALLKEGLAFHRIGAIKEARLLLERVTVDYPKSSEAKLAGERLKKMGSGKK
jgi:tol-pal system protein YbgF